MRAPALTRLNTHLPDSGDPDKSEARFALPLLRLLPLIVVVTLSGALIGLLVATLRPVTYAATTHIYPVDPRDAGNSNLAAPAPSGQGLVTATVSTLTSDEVIRSAAERLGISAGTLRGKLRASGDPVVGSVEVSVSDGVPARAAQQLQAVLTALDGTLSDQRAAYLKSVQDRLVGSAAALRADLDKAAPGSAQRTADQAALAGLTIRLQSLSEAAAELLPPFYQPAPVQAPLSPESPGRVVVVLAGAMLGLVGSTAYAWRRTERSPLVRDRHDLAALTGVPVLGQLERTRTASALQDPGGSSSLVEALLQGRLRTGGEQRTLSVTGVHPHDAVGRVAMALGMLAAKGGGPVCVLGAAKEDMDAEQALHGQAQAIGKAPRLSVTREGVARLQGPGHAWDDDGLVVLCEPPPSFAALAQKRGEGEPDLVLVVHKGCPQGDVRRTVDLVDLSGRRLLGCVFATVPRGAPGSSGAPVPAHASRLATRAG